MPGTTDRPRTALELLVARALDLTSREMRAGPRSLVDLARALGTDRGTLAKYLDGRRPLRRRGAGRAALTVEGLAEVVGLDVEAVAAAAEARGNAA